MTIPWVKRADKMQALLFYWMQTLDDADRDLSLSWSAMHLYGSAQLAKLLALQRGLDADLAACMGALHDIATILSKRSKGHAHRAGPYFRQILEAYHAQYGSDENMRVTPEEEALILRAIEQHGDKLEDSGEPYAEMLKDVDVLEHALHGLDKPDEQARWNRLCQALDLAEPIRKSPEETP
ncbi:MAG TPA: HD domain-containing protein [Clostridia bacterium]|nr:HD domain-containing protein [Clostridia bacterium]